MRGMRAKTHSIGLTGRQKSMVDKIQTLVADATKRTWSMKVIF
jgi:hypothetical protein